MRVAIVGAGVAGLTAGYTLAEAGHEVVIYEAADYVGGLAAGFRDEHWNWPLEQFYHHLFETDTAMRGLVQRIGYSDRLFFQSPTTAHWWQGQLYAIDSPLNILRFPGMPFRDRVRFGAVVAYLKYATDNWRRLERSTAVEWSQRWIGQPAYEAILDPLIEGKFGPYTPQVNMAWLWARFKARSFKLGYFRGGFQGFADALLARFYQYGGHVRLSTPVQRIAPAGNQWTIASADGSETYDRVIVTSSPRLLTRMTPDLPSSYVSALTQLNSLGAVVAVLALTRPLTDGLYWIQGMRKDEFPFLALVEHTNFIPPEHYGGDHLIYCGDYLPADHRFFQMSPDEVIAEFLPHLARFNPDFSPEWVRKTWLHRAPYAQPVVELNHSKNVPPLATPLTGLYWASMSQVYPWDRGTNFAVELGERVAIELLRAGAR